MALNNSGPISLAGNVTGQSIALELSLGATTQISLNDTVVRNLASIVSGTISLSNFYGVSSYTFYGRGFFIGNTNNWNIEFFTYSTETGGLTGSTLGVRYYTAGQGSTGTKAYWAGGTLGTTDIGSRTTDIEGINQATFALTNPTSTLNEARAFVTACRSVNKLYVAGGGVTGTGDPRNTINSVDWSNDAAGVTAATLSSARSYWGASGSADTQTRGYWFGGSVTNEIDGLIFSTESNNNPGAALVLGTAGIVTTQSTTSMYSMGWYGPDYYGDFSPFGFAGDTLNRLSHFRTTQRFDFSTETNNNTGLYSEFMYDQTGAGVSSPTAGYFKLMGSTSNVLGTRGPVYTWYYVQRPANTNGKRVDFSTGTYTNTNANYALIHTGVTTTGLTQKSLS
jgi:hypothetical protein